MMELGGALGTTAELAVILKLKNEMKGPLSEASAELRTFNRQTATVGSATKKIGAGLAAGAKVAAAAIVGIGAAATVVGVEATKSAMTFQADMEMIRTQAHASQSEVDSMTKSLIAMAGQVGFSPDELSSGLYHLESTGFRGAKALDALKIAAEGAKIGHANLEDVTNGLDAVLVAGGKDAENMAGSMGELNAIVGSGDMHMQDLADALGTGILATAHTFSLSLADIGAALATMGDNNIRGAQAATKLRMSISLMGAPSAAAVKALSSIGLSAIQLNQDFQQGGLIQGLEDLKSHLDNLTPVDLEKITGKSLKYIKNNYASVLKAAQGEILSRAFGGGKSSGTIQMLVQQLDRLKTKYAEVTGAATTFGADWTAQQLTVAQESQDMQAAFEALKITLGQELLPVATRVFLALTGFFSAPSTIAGVKSLGDAIAGLFSQQNIDAAMSFANHVIPQMKEFASEVIPPLLSGLRLTASIGKEAFSMFNSLPGPIKTIVIAALAGNKLTGGLVASGIADLGKILIGAFKNAATAEMNVAAGVVNVAGGAGMGGAPLAAAGGSAAIPIALLAVTALGIAKQVADTGEFRQQTEDLRNRGLTNAEAVAYGVYEKGGIANLQGEARQGLTNSLLSQGTNYNDALASALVKLGLNLPNVLNAQGHAPIPGALGSQQYIDQAIQAAKAQTDATKAGTAATVHALDAIHLDFQVANAALKKATTPADILASAKSVMKDLLGGVGNVKTTKDVLADLKAKELTVTDPAIRKQMDVLIRQAETKLASRQQIATLVNKDEGILKSGHATKQQLADIHRDEQALRARGDIHAAQQLRQLEKIGNKNTSPTVNVSVSTSISVRDTVRLNQQYVRYGPPVRA